jgi:hypothetical protein
MPQIRFRGEVYDLDEPLHGAEAIAKIRNQSERQVYHAVYEGRFAFRKDGRTIVTTPREALEPLIGAEGLARLIITDKAETETA